MEIFDLVEWSRSISIENMNETWKSLVRGPPSFMKIFWYELDGFARSRSKSGNELIHTDNSIVDPWKYFDFIRMTSLDLDQNIENTKWEDGRSCMKIFDFVEWHRSMSIRILTIHSEKSIVDQWKYCDLSWMKSLEVDRKFGWKCPTIEMKSMKSYSWSLEIWLRLNEQANEGLLCLEIFLSKVGSMQ